MEATSHNYRSASEALDEGESGCHSSDVTERVKGAAAYVGDKANRAAEAVGAGMESLGGVIRQHEPAAGMLHNAGEAVADKLEGSGRYLEQNGLQGIGEDVTNLIRRHPMPALLIGVGVGILLAGMVRR